MRAHQRFAPALLACALALCTSAHADVGMTLKKLTWDPRQPDSTPYQDTVLDAFMGQLIAQAWTDMQPNVVQNVVKAITQQPLGKGISLYDVDLRLPATLSDTTVIATSPLLGALRLTLTHNVMEFKATHPLTSRDTDPRMRVTFDLMIDLPFILNGNKHPPLSIVGVTPRAFNVDVTPLNASAALGIAISDIEALVTNSGNFTQRVAYGIDNSARGMTGTVTSYLNKYARQLDVPAGYKYNGGRVDAGRITIAAWQPKVLPTANISVQATWDGKYGLLLPNCDPLELRVTMPYAPPPFGQPKHIDSDNYPSGPSGSVQTGKDYACNQTIAGVQGVAGTLLYKENVVDPSHPREPGYDTTVRAVPVNWSNPRIVGDAARGKAQFRLDVHVGTHDGSQQRDRFQQMVRGNPGDPVERSNPATNPATRAATTTNPAANVTNNQASQRAVSAFRTGAAGVNGALNPQPLPPGPPDPNKAQVKSVTPASSLGTRPSSDPGAVAPPSALGK